MTSFYIAKEMMPMSQAASSGNIPKNQDKMFDIGCNKFKMISFVKIFSRKGKKMNDLFDYFLTLGGLGSCFVAKALYFAE